MLQVESHPYFRNDALRRWCASEGIHVTAYSPLGSPDSAAMFKRSTRALLEEPAVLEVAARLGKTAGQARALCKYPAALELLEGPTRATPVHLIFNEKGSCCELSAACPHRQQLRGSASMHLLSKL